MNLPPRPTQLPARPGKIRWVHCSNCGIGRAVGTGLMLQSAIDMRLADIGWRYSDDLKPLCIVCWCPIDFLQRERVRWLMDKFKRDGLPLEELDELNSHGLLGVEWALKDYIDRKEMGR